MGILNHRGPLSLSPWSTRPTTLAPLGTSVLARRTLIACHLAKLGRQSIEFFRLTQLSLLILAMRVLSATPILHTRRVASIWRLVFSDRADMPSLLSWAPRLPNQMYQWSVLLEMVPSAFPQTSSQHADAMIGLLSQWSFSEITSGVQKSGIQRSGTKT